MATAAPVKRETLKSIGNVPDWVLKQRIKDKKDAPAVAKPTRPRITLKPKAISASVPASLPVVAPAITKPPVVPQPIKEEVNDPKEAAVLEPTTGSKIRRIYSREFLIKFRYSAAPFPPGVQTPADIVAQYNKDYEQRERPAPEAKTTPTEVPSVVAPEKRFKKRKEGDGTTEEGPKREKTFKLRGLTTNDSILNSPLFRASAKASPTLSKRAVSPSVYAKGEDKENPVVVSATKLARSSSTSRRAPSPFSTRPASVKRTLTLPSIAPPNPEFVSLPPVAIEPSTPVAPVVVATPVEAIPKIALIESAPTQPVPIESVLGEIALQAASVEKTDETVDALAKKLKAALKETDPRRLAQRQKQIEYGKATLGYKDYMKMIAKSKRKREDPKTPNKYQVCSKRSWDGQIRKWRRMLHMYDPAELKDEQSKNLNLDGDVDMSDSKPEKFVITAADILAEEAALLAD